VKGCNGNGVLCGEKSRKTPLKGKTEAIKK
jgi:hypothetical protein